MIFQDLTTCIRPPALLGVPPIELVDGDLLVDMFEHLELGLIPKRTYDIDEKFFDEYK